MVTVAKMRPETTLAALDFLLHRHDRIVGVDHPRLPDAVSHQFDERPDQHRCRQHPGAHGRACDVDVVPFEDRLQAIQRKVISHLAGDDVRQQPRPDETFFNWPPELRRLLRRDHLRPPLAGVLFAGLAGVRDADVLEDLEVRGEAFELFADFLADAVARGCAAGALLLLVGEVVDDADAREVLGQFAPAVVVSVPGSAAGELLAGLVFDGCGVRGVQRHGVDINAEQHQLKRVKALGLGAVEPAEDRIDRGLDCEVDGGLLLGLQPLTLRIELRIELFLRLAPDLLDRPGMPRHLLGHQPLEQRRIVG